MPYRIAADGVTIEHKKGGKWSVKQKATSAAHAKSAMRLLQGVEHGWQPNGNHARMQKMSGK